MLTVVLYLQKWFCDCILSHKLIKDSDVFRTNRACKLSVSIVDVKDVDVKHRWKTIYLIS